MNLEEVLARLESYGTQENLEGMARYGITATKAFGVSVRATKSVAKVIGKDHALAQELWASGWYEARLLAAFIGEPEEVTPEQMDSWAGDFENWAEVDTVCFHLFDRTPHAWQKAEEWATAEAEFVKRAAFALVWALTVHDKKAPDEPFLESLSRIEEAAKDERNFVKKAVDMALRAIGKRNEALNAAAISTAQRLSEAEDKTRNWVGRHALKELTSSKVQERFAGA